uniref:Uncharacterized protein n=1 Tax=Leersia perrieri TaxID=77586 RepID=A0A0D9XVW5_9ORYZ
MMQVCSFTAMKEKNVNKQNMDKRFAKKHKIPVQVLQQGIPQALIHAEDDLLLPGRIMRVSSDTLLATALSEAGPGGELITIYVTRYLPLACAPGIRKMVAPQTVEVAKPTPFSFTMKLGSREKAEKTLMELTNSKKEESDTRKLKQGKEADESQLEKAKGDNSVSTISKPNEEAKMKKPVKITNKNKMASNSNKSDGQVQDEHHAEESQLEKAKGDNKLSAMPKPNEEAKMIEHHTSMKHKEKVSDVEKTKDKAAGLVIGNIDLLEAKEKAMKAISEEISVFEGVLKNLESLPNSVQANELIKSLTAPDAAGLQEMLNVKERYLLAHLKEAGEDGYRTTMKILKTVDRDLYKALQGHTQEHVTAALAGLKINLERKHSGAQGSSNGTERGPVVTWLIEKHITKLKKLCNEHTLLGSSLQAGTAPDGSLTGVGAAGAPLAGSDSARGEITASTSVHPVDSAPGETTASTSTTRHSTRERRPSVRLSVEEWYL